MAFILGQLKLEEFGLSPECEYASRTQQFLAAYAKQRGPGAIIDSEAFAEPLFEHATNSFIGSLINRHTPAPNTDTGAVDGDAGSFLDKPKTDTRGVFPATVSEVKAAIASVEEKYGPERTLSLKRPAKPPLLFVFKQIVDSAIKAKHDGWHPGIVDEVIRFLKNPDTFMPMMAIDSMRSTHIASICSQVVERDPRAQADGQLFYMLLSQNRSQLKHYVGELGL